MKSLNSPSAPVSLAIRRDERGCVFFSPIRNPHSTLRNSFSVRIAQWLAVGAVLWTLGGAVLSSSAYAQLGVGDKDIASLQSEEGDKALDSVGRESHDPWTLLLRMLGSLAVVLGLIALCAYGAKRFLPRSALGAATRADAIRVVATRMLGGRRSLLLVRVRGQTLLLGVTPQSIACLTEIHDVEGEWAQPTGEGPAPKTSPFSRHLGAIVNKSVDD